MSLGGEMDTRSYIVLEHAASFMYDLGPMPPSWPSPVPWRLLGLPWASELTARLDPHTV